MNKKILIISIVLFAVVGVGYFIYQQSQAMDDDTSTTPNAGHIPPQQDKSTESYISSTSTDRYVVDIAVDDTGIETIDNANHTNIQQSAAEIIAMATSVATTIAPYEYAVTSQSYGDSRSGLESQVLSSYQYTGGAHGMVNFDTWTYDADSEKIYSLTDILRKEEESVQYLYKQVESMASEFNPDNVWVQEGSGTDWNNYELFYMREGGITIIFPPYQIAPYAAGIFELELSWQELSPYLQAEFTDTLE